LSVPNENALLFGFFEASNSTIATELLNTIEEIAIQNDLDKVIGPINGSTWYNYRLMDSFENNAFLGEEITPIKYNEYLKSNHFKILKSYTSNMASSASFSEELIAER